MDHYCTISSTSDEAVPTDLQTAQNRQHHRTEDQGKGKQVKGAPGISHDHHGIRYCCLGSDERYDLRIRKVEGHSITVPIRNLLDHLKGIRILRIIGLDLQNDLVYTFADTGGDQPQILRKVFVHDLVLDQVQLISGVDLVHDRDRGIIPHQIQNLLTAPLTGIARHQAEGQIVGAAVRGDDGSDEDPGTYSVQLSMSDSKISVISWYSSQVFSRCARPASVME